MSTDEPKSRKEKRQVASRFASGIAEQIMVPKKEMWNRGQEGRREKGGRREEKKNISRTYPLPKIRNI